MQVWVHLLTSTLSKNGLTVRVEAWGSGGPGFEFRHHQINFSEKFGLSSTLFFRWQGVLSFA